MKKALSLLMALTMLFTLCACGDESESTSSTETVVLTTDNVNTYIDVKAKVVSCDIDGGN